MRIGLTGGIGCGASEVSRRIQEKGIEVIKADELGHQVLEFQAVKQQLVEHFGNEILDPNESINRGRLGQIVFSDEERRKEFNRIVHPILVDLIADEVRKIEERRGIVVVDAALIYEWKIQSFFHKIITVEAPLQMRIQRLRQRDHFTEEQALQRINAQLPVEKKTAKADFVISNEGTLKELWSKTDAVWDIISNSNSLGR